MNRRYRVDLNATERAELTALLSGGKHAARKIKRAQILLAADGGVSDEVIAAASRLVDQRSTEPNAASWKATWNWL
jgi:hypothetical protein